jgi:signal transduction histidine kinase
VNIQSLSALIAAIVTFAIGWSVVLRDRTRRAYNHFSALCFNLCLWHLFSFLQVTLDSDAMYFASLLAAVAIPITSLRFFRTFLADEQRVAARPPRTLTAIAVAFAVAIGYAIVFRKHNLHHALIFTGPLTLYVFGGLYGSMATIYAAYRRTVSRVEKTRLVYLLVGGAVSITLAGADLLPKVGISFPAVGNVLVIVYMYFLSQTLFRYRLLDLNELLGKMVVLSTFVLILAAIYGLLVAWIPADQPGVFFFNTVVASFVILILFEPLRAKVEGQVNKWMFREKHELRQRIDTLRFTLANVIDVREAIRLVVASLEESRRVTHAAIYLADQDGSGYELHGHLGPRPVDRVDAAARRPFVERLTSVKGGAVLSLEQLEREQAGRPPDDPHNETLDAIARALDEVHAGVCVPILAGEQLLGLLCLKDERLREAYATDEIDLFRALAAQLAITLQNSKIYERMKERDRLAALGEMAAGLAHEIRNPLGAIKGAAQLLTPGPDEVPTEQLEFLGVIVEEVNRLNKVVSQFLDYARPYRGELEPLDVNEVVRKTSQLMQADAKVELQVALDENLPRVRADAEQLRQVFLNLAINAMQAMPEGGKLTISSGLRKRRGNAPPQVEVRFRDTGAGIPQAEMKNLFIPFFTTKEKGTGLGLPISQRIVENHGGAIEVRSRPGVGSTFTVVLPALEKEKEREVSAGEIPAARAG